MDWIYWAVSIYDQHDSEHVFEGTEASSRWLFERAKAMSALERVVLWSRRAGQATRLTVDTYSF